MVPDPPSGGSAMVSQPEKTTDQQTARVVRQACSAQFRFLDMVFLPGLSARTVSFMRGLLTGENASMAG